MKREEKNALSIQKILDNARIEFADKGYGLSSVNTICSEGEISKGILYHYFKDKDEIYLTCIQQCFDGLTAYLRQSRKKMEGKIEECLDSYFSSRFQYFSENPEDQKLFCEAIISPPNQLKEKIAEIKAEYDNLNIEVLDDILSLVKLRPDVTRQEVIDTFRQYQDFINARYQMTGAAQIDGKERERSCEKALLVLLYGVISRE
jgi:TetR/AcrR family transcriptional regulator